MAYVFATEDVGVIWKTSLKKCTRLQMAIKNQGQLFLVNILQTFHFLTFSNLDVQIWFQKKACLDLSYCKTYQPT